MKKTVKQTNPASLVRLKQKGQVVIPDEVRQKLKLAEGDYLEVSTDGRRMIFAPKNVMIIDR